MLSDSSRLFTFMLPDHINKQRDVGLAGGVGEKRAALLELQKRAHHRVVAVEENVVEKDALLFQALALCQALSIEVAGAMVKFVIPGWIAPPEVGHQGFSGKIMREQPLRACLYKRKAA